MQKHPVDVATGSSRSEDSAIVRARFDALAGAER